MDLVLQKDLDLLSNLLEETKNNGLEFLKTVDGRKTSTINNIDPERSLNQKGLGAAKTLEVFKERFDEVLVASTGARYWGYVTGGATPASIMGDWLATVYDQNTQGMTGQGDVSAIIELETIELLKSLLNISGEFLGGFVTGATMSNFTCLSVARQWYGKQIGKDYAKEGVSDTLNILSATPHSSSVKALAMLGVGSRNIIKVKIVEGNREAIDVEDLEKKIKELKGKPFILISSAGTVNTVDFDDFLAIEKLKKKYNFWWHIDAAFGAFVACSSKYSHLLKGWNEADSITTDCHKWLNVPYESAFYLIKREYNLLQVESFQNSNAPYLGDPLENFNYLNFLPENSRRLKALPAWFTLKAYGKEGYKEIIERNIELAKKFGDFIVESKDFELLAPVRLNTVCFTLKGKEESSARFLHLLNKKGAVFMTPTVYKGKKGIRAAIVNWRTVEKDVFLAIEVMEQTVNEL
ncbi:Aspartate aminotransferase family protein [Tenacibaculum sp. 190524A02b]|uniref:Aspartate aminotransferase family protein n=1 Tax=Tenacibaculum vairaonense TaxID=3137860 RepID=A0ABM9PI53_9FLAO